MLSCAASLMVRSCAIGSPRIAPSPWSSPWDEVIRDFTFPVQVIVTIPPDDKYPQPDQVARRFDGGDERIFNYDYGLDFWRKVPDIATFQVWDFYWCIVTAADATFWERVTFGTGHPPTSLASRDGYPNCQPTD